jgi:hypothetical protein
MKMKNVKGTNSNSKSEHAHKPENAPTGPVPPRRRHFWAK